MATRGPRVTINVKGMEGVKRMMDAAKKAFDPGLVKDAILPAAMILRDEAKRRAPIGRGRKEGRSLRRQRRRWIGTVSLEEWSQEHMRNLIFAAKGKPGLPDVIVGIDTRKAPQAYFIEYGTTPHRIDPIPPKTLLFVRAFMKFLPFVMHPGQKKKPFLRPAIRASKRRMAAEMENGLRKLLDRTLPRST